MSPTLGLNALFCHYHAPISEIFRASLKGNLGSYHTDLSVNVFRGFVISDAIAPFVTINDHDPPSAKSFTLLHEFAHLLLGDTGISGHFADAEDEVFCNNVASECLLPTEELSKIDLSQSQSVTEKEQWIRSFARSRNLSHTMVAYRLLQAGSIDQPTFNELRSCFHDRWQQERKKRRSAARDSNNKGPSYYVVHRYRVGTALLSLTGRMMRSGALSTTKAAKILGVQAAHVGKVLGSA